MEKKLLNKNIVITGASSGIGEKVAILTAELGARPILLARSTEKLKEICEIIKQKTEKECSYYTLDVSNFEQVKAVFNKIYEEVGRIDILLNNAGFGIFESLQESSLDEIRRMFEVNVLGLIACTKEVIPHMLENNSGHIINIASQAGKVGSAKSSGYSATKHAVLGFTNSLRLELFQTNITISAVNPGPIETNFFIIADKSGTYVKNINKFMLKADFVAEQIVKLMIHPKRELNLPKWMNTASIFYQLFPGFLDKLLGKTFNMK
ncbi:MAG TPA: SDR family oxidoreductase [Bacillales bacterium]|nr:SDR family oxidoreductase [Bacillales bacterium]